MEKLLYLISNFRVHEKCIRNENDIMVPLKIFKIRTNVLICRRCNHLAVKRKRQPRHDCIFGSQSQQVIHDAAPQNDSIFSVPSSDEESPTKRSRRSFDSNCSETQIPPTNIQKCKNYYYLRQNELSMKIECNERATEEHRMTCRARFGTTRESEKWCEQSNNRNNFMHVAMDFLLSPLMRGSFSTVFNTKLSKMSSNEDWLVEKSKSVRGVQITKPNCGSSYFISTSKATKIISANEYDIRELAGPFASRRQFENRLQILRRMQIQVPPNMRRCLAACRDQIRRYSQIIEFNTFRSSIDPNWSALVVFTPDGLENYLNELIMESTIFDYSTSLTVAIDAGKSFLKASLILNTPKHKLSHDYQGKVYHLNIR